MDEKVSSDIFAGCTEFFIQKNFILGFKGVPDFNVLKELRDLVDSIEETNKEFPINFG